MPVLSNPPCSLVVTPEFEAGGVTTQQQLRPRLSVRWIRDDEGRLICRWGRW